MNSSPHITQTSWPCQNQQGATATLHCLSIKIMANLPKCTLIYISHIISQYFRYVIIPGPNSLHFQIFTSLWNLSFLHWLVSGPGHRSSPASGLPFLVLFGIREHLVSPIRWRPPLGIDFLPFFEFGFEKGPWFPEKYFGGHDFALTT